MIQHLYTLQIDHHDKSSDHLSPYKGIAELLIMFPVLYITSQWTNLFCNWKFVPLNLLHLFHTTQQSPPLWWLPVCSLYLWVCFYLVLFFIFHIQVKSYGICLSVWLISLSIILSRSIHVVVNGKISFFFMTEQYYIVYMYIFFIHLSIGGYLSCFHILPIAVNIGVHISFLFNVFVLFG